MMYSDESPRNWKWMVPAVLLPVMVIAWNWLVGIGQENLASVPLGIGVVLLVAAVVNLWAYVQYHAAAIFADVQLARSSTPEVRMFEAAKQMHPDAVQALLIHRRTLWRIKYVPVKDIVEWILDEAPSVHAGFVDFVLDHSTDASVMSKGLLSEGSKQFDPDGLITDRAQYDALMDLMMRKLMCTQALGNQSARWLAPWTPSLVRHRFGLDGEQYVLEDDPAVQAVIRAKQKAAAIQPQQEQPEAWPARGQSAMALERNE